MRWRRALWVVPAGGLVLGAGYALRPSAAVEVTMQGGGDEGGDVASEPTDRPWTLYIPLEWDEEADPRWDFAIDFTDLAAVDHEDAVQALAAWLQTYPGVEQAYHQDREVIVLRGQLDRAALERDIDAFWTERVS